jgi:tetratricopeptide (TPR) repeat protein
MGVIYEAYDKELGRLVALKVLTEAAGLSAGAYDRFLREARAAARLAHPNIAAIYDAEPGRIAMQLVEGRTLAQLRADEPPPPRLIARLLRDAAVAVHFAHQRGIVHRDLKPANLMVEDRLDEPPHLYVMDFGLAKETSAVSSLSGSGSVLGTPAYMAPEQAAGRSEEVGPESDVYSLGATLYELCAGEPPFAGTDVYQLLRQAVETEPPRLERVAPGVPRELGTIAMKCLAKESSERYATARDLADDLDRWLAGEPIHARSPTVLYRLRKFVARRKLVLGAGAGAALVVALTLVPFLVAERAERSAAELALTTSRAERDAAERALVLGRRVASALADAEAYRRAGTPSYSVHERLQVAVDACRELLLSFETPHTYQFLGELLRRQLRYEEAEAAYERAIELDSGLMHARFGLGLCLAQRLRDGPQTGPDLEALRARTRVLLAAALPDSGDSTLEESETDRLFAQATLAWIDDDPVRAERLLRETLEVDRTYFEAYQSLSRLAYDADDDTTGLRYAVSASDILRGFGRVYAERSVASLATGESPLLILSGVDGFLITAGAEGFSSSNDALSFASQAQFQARRAAEWGLSGNSVESLQAWDIAVELYGSALAVDPSAAALHANRGLCLTQRELGLTRSESYGAAASARAQARADFEARRRLLPAAKEHALIKLALEELGGARAEEPAIPSGTRPR